MRRGGVLGELPFWAEKVDAEACFFLFLFWGGRRSEHFFSFSLGWRWEELWRGRLERLVETCCGTTLLSTELHWLDPFATLAILQISKR
jgi:hypothetical protein